MAGFIENSGNSPKGVFGILSKSLKTLSSLGMQYDDMVIKQSMSVGPTEFQFGQQGYADQDMLYSLSMADIGQKKYIAFFDKDYKSRREYIRKFAMNPEIEFILETIADDAIVYSDNNFFANIGVKKLKEVLDSEKSETIIEEVLKQYKRIYNLFHFSEGHDAWGYMKQFLVDGFLAFEIIYDVTGKTIIGFKELDATSLRPGVEKDSEGKYRKIWVQYEEHPQMKRTLLDSQVIYISYAKGSTISRVSYCERLIRSFNLLRIMENSRVIWNIMNSSYRMKMVVPIGSKSPQKAKESVAELMNFYKEDINLDFDSGVLNINGSPGMQLYKNYLFPSKNGESPEIEVIGGEGFDLSDTDALKYFKNKLIEDSKIPNSRFERESGGGVFSLSADGIERDEIRYNKFVVRLRSIFQEILLKPLFLQMGLIYEELQGDELFKSVLALEYQADNLFEELKQMEIMEKRVNMVSTMMGVIDTELDATGMSEEVPYFAPEFVIENYLKLTPEQIEMNRKMKKAKQIKDLETMKNKAAIQKELEGDGF